MYIAGKESGTLGLATGIPVVRTTQARREYGNRQKSSVYGLKGERSEAATLVGLVHTSWQEHPRLVIVFRFAPEAPQ